MNDPLFTLATIIDKTTHYEFLTPSEASRILRTVRCYILIRHPDLEVQLDEH